MTYKKTVCKITGHSDYECPNGCFNHGFCKSCGMYFSDGKWYDNWQDAKKERNKNAKSKV